MNVTVGPVKSIFVLRFLFVTLSKEPTTARLWKRHTRCCSNDCLMQVVCLLQGIPHVAMSTSAKERGCNYILEAIEDKFLDQRGSLHGRGL